MAFFFFNPAWLTWFLNVWKLVSQKNVRFKGNLQPWKDHIQGLNLRLYSALFWDPEDLVLVRPMENAIKYKCLQKDSWG